MTPSDHPRLEPVMNTIKPTITDEIIEKCARALWDEPGWEQASPEQRQYHREAAERALSAVIADVRAEGAAEALHAALYDLEIAQSSHDVAECAAPVPGEVGRQDAIDRWISICEEPVEWMWRFAQGYAHEAPSDAYIREIQEEARAAGRREVFDDLRMFRDEADKPLAVDLGNMVRAWLDREDGGAIEPSADQIETGRCCTHAECPGGSLCCCTEGAGR